MPSNETAYADALADSLSKPEHFAAVLARNPDLMKGYAELVNNEHAQEGTFGHMVQQALTLAEVAVKVQGDDTNVTPLFGNK